MTGIYPIGPADQAKVLALNNQFAVETSLLDAPKLAAMVKEAFLATRIGEVDAFLIVFDQEDSNHGHSGVNELIDGTGFEVRGQTSRSGSDSNQVIPTIFASRKFTGKVNWSLTPIINQEVP